eukprot:TRINITY_DN12866_c0_g1_i1.p1 TRINITY_DN12866_c0_g1~~TRINITY_DN12866_c0_g1_i1.p1  ORF type:complete len:113 (-),score=18.13 TRINITY_DN12866_c0_g1_i1:66-404(-)
MHMSCGLKKRGNMVTRLSQFRNWTALKYDDQRKIRKHTGELKSATEEAKNEVEQRRVSDLVRQLKENMTLEEMLDVLQANRVTREEILGVDVPKRRREELFIVLRMVFFTGP